MVAGADQGLAPARIERQLNSSLERLGVERVELYLGHEFDPEVPLTEIMATFASQQAAGLIGAYGVSNFNASQLQAAVDAGSPVAIQNACSLLEQDDREEVLPLCERDGVAYLAFSPLAGGWLTGKYRRDQPYPPGSRMTQRPEPYAELAARSRTFDALEALGGIARERGISMAGVALAWLLADHRIAQVVVGPMRPEHLDPVAEALGSPLGPREAEQLGAMFA
jgi:aryl-alcohol dehydrogenase-like predicted oxidoreductase